MNSFGTRQHEKGNLILGEVACNTGCHTETGQLEYFDRILEYRDRTSGTLGQEDWNIGTRRPEY
jgi:hypothetical protein